MKNNEKILERLTEVIQYVVIDQKLGNIKGFATHAGYNYHYLIGVLGGSYPVSNKLIDMLVRQYNANAAYIEQGRGERFLNSKPVPVTRIPNIYHVPIAAEAGFADGYITDAANEEMYAYSIPGLDEPAYSFEVKNDSMYPTLLPGEILITSQHNITDIQDLNPRFLYVVVLQNNILVKRLRFNEEQQCVILISDNERYPEQAITAEELRYIFKVRRIIKYDTSAA